MTFLGLTLLALCRSEADTPVLPAPPDPRSAVDSAAQQLAIPANESAAATRSIRLDDRTVEGHVGAPTDERALGRTELAQSATLADALSLVPGVEVRRMGGLGGFSEVSLRQCPSQQVRVTLDGITLRDDAGSMSDIGGLAAESLEKVEVVQGAAAGGDGRPELRLTSRRGWSRWGGSLTAGSFGERQASCWWGDPSGGWSLVGWAQTARNDWPFFWDHGTKRNKKDDGIVSLPNNDYTQYGASVAWRPGTHTQWVLRGDNSDKGVTGLYTANPAARYRRSNVQLTADSRGEERWDVPWQMAVRLHRSQWRDSAGGLDYRSNSEASDEGYNASGSIALVHQEGEWLDGQVRAGVSHEENSWSSITPRKVHLTPDADRNAAFVAARWNGQDPSRTLGVSLSGRLETVRDGRNVSASPMDGTVAIPDTSWSAWVDDEQARVWVGTSDKSCQGWLATSHTLRAPDFYEIYGDNGMTFANYRLRPEESWTSEAGVRLDGLWWSMRAQPWIGYYHTPIRREMIGASLASRFENDSGYFAQGLDGDASLCGRFGSVRVQGSYSVTELRSDLAAYRGKERDHSPRWRWNGSLGTPLWMGLLLEATSNYTSSSWATALNGPKDRRPGHTLYGARFSWRYKSFTLLAQGDNLTDEQFEEFADAPLAGRAFRVRIEWNQPTKGNP